MTIDEIKAEIAKARAAGDAAWQENMEYREKTANLRDLEAEAVGAWAQAEAFEKMLQLMEKRQMQVLLVWKEIPEYTKLYKLEGEDAELAIKAHGHYINNASENDAVIELSERLCNMTPIGISNILEIPDISDCDKVVIAGLVM